VAFPEEVTTPLLRPTEEGYDDEYGVSGVGGSLRRTSFTKSNTFLLSNQQGILEA